MKKRVYDLAKEYGMTGQQLAAKLRDLGFAQVKSHMTALSEFEVLEIQARLEAYGIVGESSGQSVTTVGGLKIKRKKKKKKTKGAATTTEAPEPESPAAESPEAAAPAPAVEEAEVEPAKEEEAPAAEEPAPEPAVAEVAAAEPEPVAADAAVEAPVEDEPAAPEAVAEPAEAVEVAAETETAPIAEEAAEAETVEAAEAVEPETAEPETPEVPEEQIVRPSAKRRTGKVVGFIDPAQFERKTQPRSQSRRLRSADDDVPNVMPTLGRDRHAGMVRGDTTRGKMTAQELREREAGRFLRRRRVQQTGPGRRTGAATRTEAGPTGSPYAGGSLAIEAPVTIKKLANALAIKESQVLGEALKQLGLGVNINSVIDDETAVLLANEFEVELAVKQEVAAEAQLLGELAARRGSIGDEELVKRAPTVAFLGHVDHGKTTLIDTIRKSRIASGEAGGITQHIGAYQVTTQHGHTLTIIDTPGHAAFTAMRARGAKAVDIVVLVVAADDGVKPQTEEALNHARVANTPVVVAINKVDKAEANPERVRNELAGLDLVPEDWGGQTAMLEVSALRGDGIEDLLERVFLETEVLELQSHPTGPASGVVLEAEIQQGKGKVGRLLIQDGSLQRGDVILAGVGYGKVRSIHDDRGKQLKDAGPSMPIEVTGLNELPMVGDHFYVVDSLDRAQEVAAERARSARLMADVERRPVRHEDIFEAVAEQEKTTINLIVKADTQGSVEVLKHQIGELHHEEMDVRVLHAGVGQVLDSDVDLAANSDARILAFHTSSSNKVRQRAERSGVDVKVYTVLYELLDDVKRLMEGELAPEFKEEITGHVEIRRLFKSSKFGNIAGCFVLDGSVHRRSKIRLLRDGQIVHTGEIGSLRREKDDAKEVREGFECGILIKDYNDVREGDIIETFKIVEIKRTL